MSTWVTEMEQRELEQAQRRGYLIMRERQRFLELAWRRWCDEQGEPCVRLVKGQGNASVTLNMSPIRTVLEASEIEAVRKYLKSVPAAGPEAPGSVLPIVYRGGVYTHFMTRPRAEKTALFLLETARACAREKHAAGK
ncbi:MAG: hypothetical protein HY319_01975 [Armatimonadetes bacterium]|nr:hypothetical protein [Armatimonadota bacterium]